VNHEILGDLIHDFKEAENIQLLNVGRVFLRMVDYLKIYAISSSNHPISLTTYEKLKQTNKEFATFIQETENKTECKGVPLLGFLIKPVQRICKYPLLFKDLLHHTPRDHVDYENIEQCEKKVHDVAVYVNERKRASENFQKMLLIQEGLTDAPKNFMVVQPGRVFVRESILVKSNPRGKLQERHFFLFSDSLLYTKVQMFNKGTFQFKGTLPLDCCLVKDVPDTEHLQNAFELVRMDTQKRKYVIGCSSPIEKQLWMKDLEKIIDSYLKKEMEKRRSEI